MLPRTYLIYCTVRLSTSLSPKSSKGLQDIWGKSQEHSDLHRLLAAPQLFICMSLPLLKSPLLPCPYLQLCSLEILGFQFLHLTHSSSLKSFLKRLLSSGRFSLKITILLLFLASLNPTPCILLWDPLRYLPCS